MNVRARRWAASPKRLAQVVALTTSSRTRSASSAVSAARKPVSPSTIDSARPPTASAALGVRHSAASITVSDQPSDCEAVRLTQARPYSSALRSSST